MKRKELYNFVREEIVNELTVVTKDTKSDEITPIAKAENTDNVTVQNAINTAKKSGKDVNIAEMARIPKNVKIGDPEKFKMAKDIYSGGWKETMLNKIEEAGEEGIAQLALAIASGKKTQPEINPIIRELLAIGAVELTGGYVPKTKEEPEITEPETPEGEETEEPEKPDDWEKPEEEEPEIEPKTSDIKKADKTVGGKGNAKVLSPEDEEKYNKLKKGIKAKIDKILALPSSKRLASDDMKILKQLIGREDVKTLFKDKGVNLKDLVSDVL